MSAPRGLRRNALAFALGLLAVLALPPFFIFPLLIPAFSGLFLLLGNAESKRRAFWDGWFWGWGFFMAGLYWFCVALLTDPEKFGWMIPFALFGLTGVIAVYCGIACWLFKRTGKHGAMGVFSFSVIWLAIELARGYFFTGFPWNMVGYSFAVSNSSLQLASIFGAYGLTWIAVWLATLPALWFIDKAQAKKLLGISYAFLLLGIGWGAMHLSNADSESYVNGVKLRIVQANISQHHKWDPKLQMQGLNEHVALSKSNGLEEITHIIWPETAVPYVVKAHSSLTHFLGSATPPGKILITGALHLEESADDYQIFNSMITLGHRGEILGSYNKHKLVPFGEFVPLRRFLPKSLLTPVGDKDFSAGPGPQTLRWPGLPAVSPLICYEAIFPSLAIDTTDRPEWLLNLTNDAWFGLSTGPHQHFTMARMRAAEQGLPLVRAANTGISGVVDAYGRVVSKLDLGTQGVLDSKLPKSAANTPFSAYGALFILGLISLALMLTILLQNKKTN